LMPSFPPPLDLALLGLRTHKIFLNLRHRAHCTVPGEQVPILFAATTLSNPAPSDLLQAGPTAHACVAEGTDYAVILSSKIMSVSHCENPHFPMPRSLCHVDASSFVPLHPPLPPVTFSKPRIACPMRTPIRKKAALPQVLAPDVEFLQSFSDQHAHTH